MQVFGEKFWKLKTTLDLSGNYERIRTSGLVDRGGNWGAGGVSPVVVSDRGRHRKSGYRGTPTAGTVAEPWLVGGSHQPLVFLWRVIAAGMERMATADATQAAPRATQGTVLFHCFNKILAA